MIHTGHVIGKIATALVYDNFARSGLDRTGAVPAIRSTAMIVARGA
jgi:hypothetical protein